MLRRFSEGQKKYFEDFFRMGQTAIAYIPVKYITLIFRLLFRLWMKQIAYIL
jgi:hypothetical protein